MAVGVVEPLEMVQVGQHQHHRLTVAAKTRKFSPHQVFPVAAVEQARQAIMLAQPLQLQPLDLQALNRAHCDVAHRKRIQHNHWQARQHREHAGLRLPLETIHQHTCAHAQRLYGQATP